MAEIKLSDALAEKLQKIAKDEKRKLETLITDMLAQYRPKPPDESEARPRYRVTARGLNVRSGPSIRSIAVGFLRRDQTVERLNISQDEYWFEILSDDHQRGWCAHKYLARIHEENLGEDEDQDWLKIAIAEIGQKEIPDPGENPRIVEYLSSTTLRPSAAQSDETAWCSGFVNWCMEKAGYEGTDSALARSWLSWGKSIDKPQRGCIVVLSRECGGSLNCGHVGFFMGQTKTNIKILGGNQDDAVSIKSYSKSNLLGYRMPGDSEN